MPTAFHFPHTRIIIKNKHSLLLRHRLREEKFDVSKSKNKKQQHKLEKRWIARHKEWERRSCRWTNFFSEVKCWCCIDRWWEQREKLMMVMSWQSRSDGISRITRTRAIGTKYERTWHTDWCNSNSWIPCPSRWEVMFTRSSSRVPLHHHHLHLRSVRSGLGIDDESLAKFVYN